MNGHRHARRIMELDNSGFADSADWRRMAVLAARILLRDSESTPEDSSRAGISVGRCVLTRNTQTVTMPSNNDQARRAVRLTDLQFRLAWFLFRHEGIFNDQKEIIAQCWGNDAGVSIRSLYTAIWQLRRLLDLLGGGRGNGEIKTLYGRGYRLRLYSDKQGT